MYNSHKLRHYQEDGRDFLAALNPGSTKNHKYLAWEPGTGKTCVVTAALIDLDVHSLLLVCPPKVKRQWVNHLIDWGYCKPEDVHVVWTTNEIVPLDRKILVVSFELLLSPIILKQLKTRTYGAIVIDEAHKAKTLTSQRSNLLFGKEALAAHATIKWLVSGTPMPNGSPNEVFPAIAALYPECVGRMGYEEFLLRYCGAYQTFNGYGTDISIGTATNIDEFKHAVRDFMSFKTIAEVAPELPPVIEKLVYIDIGTLGADVHNTPMATLQRLIGEAKIDQVREYIGEWLAEHDGNLITFAYHRDVVEALTMADYSLPIYGGQNATVRDTNIARWKTDNRIRNLVIQVNAAGEAIDGLQHYANHIIFAEPDWTPGVGNQAIGRLYRIGQTKPVYVTTIVAEKTLDETKILKYDNKQDIIDRYFDSVYRSVFNGIDLQQNEEIMQFNTEQTDRIIELFDRLVSLLEDNVGSDDEGKSKTRKRRTKAEIEASKGAVQTPVVQTPIAPSAPLAAQPSAVVQTPPNGNGAQVVQSLVTGTQIQTSLPTDFEQVKTYAKEAKARLTSQIAATGVPVEQAEVQAMTILGNEIVKAHGFTVLNDAATAEPQTWLLLINAFAAKQYAAPQVATIGF